MGSVATPPLRDCILIDAGTISASTEPNDVGEFMYFVDFYDEDGASMGVYSGRSHDAALAAAKEWGVPIFDKTRPQ